MVLSPKLNSKALSVGGYWLHHFIALGLSSLLCEMMLVSPTVTQRAWGNSSSDPVDTTTCGCSIPCWKRCVWYRQWTYPCPPRLFPPSIEYFEYFMQCNHAEIAAVKLCRQLWWGNMSVHIPDRHNVDFLQCCQWTEAVGTESQAREPAVHTLPGYVEMQMSSHKGTWVVNRKVVVTSPSVISLSPQMRCLGSGCWVHDERNVNGCPMKGIYCILIWHLQAHNHATETSLG